MQNQQFYEDPQAIGTQAYHQVTLLKSLVATDGVVAMMKKLECFWIADLLLSFIRQLEDSGETFLCVKVFVDGSTANLVIDDGNDNIILTHPIEFTDLSQNVKMYLQQGGPGWVMMLPSEY